MCFLCGNQQEDEGSIVSEESQGIAAAFGRDAYSAALVRNKTFSLKNWTTKKN